MNENLFQHAASTDTQHQPLAQRMRPRSLSDIVGQQKILGERGTLKRLLDRGELPSMILWGPPGCGKTTLAQMVATLVEGNFESLSAVLAGVKQVREVITRAKNAREFQRRRTILFIDEIHRFNRAQQDALLPHVESGTVTLIGATTENPSFELNAALLSRCRLFVLEPLSIDDIAKVLRRAMGDPQRGIVHPELYASQKTLIALAAASHGDARRALGTLDVACELCMARGEKELTQEILTNALQHKPLSYDKGGEQHFAIMSAFIKSMRASDPDAAVYWMVRMLDAGEPPRSLLRRMAIFASEDIGNADPAALRITIDGTHAFDFVGMPEGALILTQVTLYLAHAKKSNQALTTLKNVRLDIDQFGSLPVPGHLRNGATPLMKQMGCHGNGGEEWGKGYIYAHDNPEAASQMNNLPTQLKGRTYAQ